jgi:hypothetical protein
MDVYLLTEKKLTQREQYLYLLQRLQTVIGEEKAFGFEIKHFTLQRWQLEPIQSLKPNVGFDSALRLWSRLRIKADALDLLWVELTGDLHSELPSVVVKLKDQAGINRSTR